MNRRPLTELLIATGNRGKVRELTELIAGLPLRLRGLGEFHGVPVAEETGATFAENAEIKARFYAAHTGLATLADDSGLEVEALGGAPGVYSARYAGEAATDAERVARLLSELRDAADASRRARFVCAAALFDPRDASCEIFLGACAGRIGREPRGSNGFGYDPVFIPDGFEQTFAELPGEIKQRISHRAKALEAARTHLAKAFPNIP
jgi:XTP/dITP diphosphohydrolase